jgi:trk system potassium uptake protein TrkH
MATGGFSTKNLSVGHFQSDFIHWVIPAFMFLAGVNFLLHYNVLKGNPRILKADREFRFYVGVIATATVIATLVLYFDGLPSVEYARTHFRNNPMPYEDFTSHMHVQEEKVHSLYGSFREATFQTVSITTTTGFGTVDFDVWPTTLRLMLLVLMFFGGCAGSTGGGMKMIRIMINIKAAWREIIKMARPRIIRPVKVGGVPVEEIRVGNIASFFILFLGLTIFSSLLMTLFIPDLVTAFTSVVACLANIGPGLAGVGSIENFNWIPIPGKWILIFNMLLGRLEIFTVLVLFRPSIWCERSEALIQPIENDLVQVRKIPDMVMGIGHMQRRNADTGFIGGTNALIKKHGLTLQVGVGDLPAKDQRRTGDAINHVLDGIGLH